MTHEVEQIPHPEYDGYDRRQTFAYSNAIAEKRHDSEALRRAQSALESGVVQLRESAEGLAKFAGPAFAAPVHYRADRLEGLAARLAQQSFDLTEEIQVLRSRLEVAQQWHEVVRQMATIAATGNDTLGKYTRPHPVDPVAVVRQLHTEHAEAVSGFAMREIEKERADKAEGELASLRTELYALMKRWGYTPGHAKRLINRASRKAVAS